MKAKLSNSVLLNGYLYEHDLQEAETGPDSKNPGTKYIRGSIKIATDDALTNIVKVFYSYVAPTTTKGANPNYPILMDILNGKYPSYAKERDLATTTKMQIRGNLGLNEFYTDQGGALELVSNLRTDGGYIRILGSLPAESERNVFDVDMVINGTKEVDADEERGVPRKLILKGCIFDWKKAMLPVEFSVVIPAAIDYFLDLDISPRSPVFTHLKGTQIQETVKRTIEGAWGVSAVETHRKDMVINWAAREPYDWNTEETILASELKQCLADREISLAQLKTNYQNRQASKATPAATKPAAQGGFNF